MYPCMLCVALLVCLFVLCVACLTVFVNCLEKQIICIYFNELPSCSLSSFSSFSSYYLFIFMYIFLWTYYHCIPFLMSFTSTIHYVVLLISNKNLPLKKEYQHVSVTWLEQTQWKHDTHNSAIYCAHIPCGNTYVPSCVVRFKQ